MCRRLIAERAPPLRCLLSMYLPSLRLPWPWPVRGLVVSSCLAICVRACRGVPDEQLDVGFGPQECRTPEVRLQTRNGRVRAVADDFIRNAFSL